MLDSFVVLDRGILVELRNDLEDEFPAILEISLQAMSERAEIIQDAITRQEIATIRKVAHQIKSNSRQLGALRVGKIAEQMEKLASSQPTSDILKWGNILVDEIGSAKLAIEEFMLSPTLSSASNRELITENLA
ncbi:MAG: Hpt domain-containing protein [Magnetococcus sp. DMHC-1]|nr:Hpt domain-containing protein [Magnetococcales bacterium]